MVLLVDATVGGQAKGAGNENGVMKDLFLKGKLRRSQLERRDVDTIVDRDLKERFPGYTYVDTDVRKIGKLTLRQEIREKKIESLASKTRISTSWWSQLIVKWNRVNSPSSQLVVKDANGVVDPNLIAALGVARSHNTKTRSAASLHAWLAAATSRPNQKELVGLLKHALSKHPAASNHCNTVIMVMRYVKRLQLRAHFPPEIAVMHHHFDAALVAQMGSMTKAGMAPAKYLEVIADISDLVISAGDLAKILGATDVSEVAGELRRVVAESQLGSILFAQMLAQLAESSFMIAVDKFIAEMLNEQDLNEENVQACMQACHDEAMKWQLDQRCIGKRNIEITYRNLILQIAVACAHEIAFFKIRAHIRQRAVAKKTLKALWFEDAIMDEIPLETKSIDWKLIKPMEAAREIINDEAKASCPSSGDVAVTMIANRLPTLLLIDESSVLDLALAKSLSSGPGASKLQQKIIDVMPTASTLKTLASAVVEMEAVAASPLNGFANKSAQAVVVDVLSTLKQMQRGYPPTFTSWGGCPNLMAIKARLPLFFEWNPSSAGAGENKRLLGAEALVCYLSHCQEVMDEEKIINIGELQCFQVFEWLLDEEQKKKSLKIIEHCYHQSSYMPLGGPPHKKAANDSTKAGKRTSTATADEDEVSNLFS